ncbi:hypothetical protein A2634_00820 [Candidatus Amesbacteria bacterium RIFCSPHIGHO2_01_FULL_48_32]|uniref:Methyltransferase type 11 domain-containing protein n=1 Tax=Candidatus Amesbacteria bacterium RIFCSPLOWO2_01_FULL_48_25 TaxID=1797259 RepID=A0A1F4ZAT3_9BACT|nr:MAG: hypothetical protein A2634_00820 [Candidatus Amesbacteria bacterium RIFCSPHIGHO2_01_FULL_48_32]OGD03348.1 MAG: hypothetical protein A2989_00770 [Candidatus Amesbacteria bacterium RIFCSPLOWO2_01_FULL_48_25]HJZ05302.1 class I SAM-dependent methyltransferase [Patescibacteria group bacterium]
MKKYLEYYLRYRPLFLSLIRAKEAWLWQKYLPLKRPVLDLGCGDGFFAKITFGHLDIGLDVKESRINEVKDGTYKKLVVYDGHKFPLKSGSVNTVVSNCVLEHIENLDEVLKEVWRVLKPGGGFLTTVMAKPWEENLAGSLLLGNTYKAWMKKKQVHFNLLDSEEWNGEFKKAGFKIEEEIGYLSPAACKLIDICHYLSLPSLVLYTLTGKWVLGLEHKLYPVDWLVKEITENAESEKSGAIFFELVKRD